MCFAKPIFVELNGFAKMHPQVKSQIKIALVMIDTKFAYICKNQQIVVGWFDGVDIYRNHSHTSSLLTISQTCSLSSSAVGESSGISTSSSTLGECSSADCFSESATGSTSTTTSALSDLAAFLAAERRRWWCDTALVIGSPSKRTTVFGEGTPFSASLLIEGVAGVSASLRWRCWTCSGAVRTSVALLAWK